MHHEYYEDTFVFTTLILFLIKNLTTSSQQIGFCKDIYFYMFYGYVQKWTFSEKGGGKLMNSNSIWNGPQILPSSTTTSTATWVEISLNLQISRIVLFWAVQPNLTWSYGCPTTAQASSDKLQLQLKLQTWAWPRSSPACHLTPINWRPTILWIFSTNRRWNKIMSVKKNIGMISSFPDLMILFNDTLKVIFIFYLFLIQMFIKLCQCIIKRTAKQILI